MKTKIGIKLMFGLVVSGLLLCGNARAAIALLDGAGTGGIFSTNLFGPTTNAAGNTLTTNFTVSAGASVMVVEVLDANGNPGGAGSDTGPFLTWSNTSTLTTQKLTNCVAGNANAYTWFWSDMYYVYTPAVGPGIVSCTETNPVIAGMLMQVYTLSGVDTNVAPYGAFNGGDNGGNSIATDTSVSTVFGSWAAVMGVNYNGGGGNNVTITAPGSLGQATQNFYPFNGNGLQDRMGYIIGLGSGDTTITSTGTGGPTHQSVTIMVLSPKLSSTASPTNLTATPGVSQIGLQWNDASSGTASSYIISRSTTSGSGYTAIATNNGVGSTNYTDSSSVNYVTYYYVVQSVGISGTSGYSAQVSANSVGLEPGPTGLTASTGDSSVVLTWNASTGASGYNVLRAIGSPVSFSTISQTASPTYTDTGLINGTSYYYEVNATNSYGTGANSAYITAVPTVWFTNYIGLFNSSHDVAYVLDIANAIGYFDNTSPPGPAPGGPSTGYLVFEATFGQGSTNASEGIRTNFTSALDVSHFANIEYDVKCFTGFDAYNQIQAIQMGIVCSGIRYKTPDVILLTTGIGGTNWSHVSIPLNAPGGTTNADLTQLQAFLIDVYDGNFTSAATLTDIGFDNIKFTHAAGIVPNIAVSSQSIAHAATSATLTGIVGNNGNNGEYPHIGTPVHVTINAVTQNTTINDTTGDFSIVYNTTGLADGAYPVAYAVDSDNLVYLGATNSATTLSVGVAPQPTILPVYVSGGQLQVRTATVVGHTYYLLQATNLAPPVVWTTNNTTAGTGGNITNSVTTSGGKLFLKYQVN